MKVFIPIFYITAVCSSFPSSFYILSSKSIDHRYKVGGNVSSTESCKNVTDMLLMDAITGKVWRRTAAGNVAAREINAVLSKTSTACVSAMRDYLAEGRLSCKVTIKLL
jgi:hypothetical protein